MRTIIIRGGQLEPHQRPARQLKSGGPRGRRAWDAAASMYLFF